MVTSAAMNECAGVSFDVEKAIASLLADPTRASLELPCSLNGEERKNAKRIAQQYREIKCESFGLGEERRMHLFKNDVISAASPQRISAKKDPLVDDLIDSEGCMSPQRVSVKNTFIDDWIESTPTKERVVQSMPHNMFGQCLTAERSSRAASAVEGNDAAASTAAATEAVPTNSQNASGFLVEEQFFALGAEVVIDGLVKAPSFNGCCGMVHSWDAETSRYNVMLAAPTAGGQHWAKLKGENLRAAHQYYHLQSPPR
jgi:hypothetical protein